MFPILLLLFLVPSAVLGDNCPKGYVNTTVNGNIFCYKVYKTLATHDQAEAQCTADGGTLVKIDGADQNAVIVNATHAQGISYIGVTCSRGSCRYDNGRILTNMSLFYGGTPTIEVGQCVVLETQPGPFYGKWLSVDCSSVSGFVCQVGPPIQPYIDALQKSGCNSIYPIYGPVNITSPGYPSPYPGGINCAYSFTGGPYTINIMDFNTSNSDYVVIYSPYYNYPYNNYYSSFSGSVNSQKFNFAYTNGLITFASNTTTGGKYRGFNINLTPSSN